ncbi:unnamed protein product [Moneuplotes crassus]|uniref:Uncharacterized protein n=1 Tax=Euplotes crassus TaxID=5936 RepID=A0AAD1Y3M4_EUPCR|nr:unnamed protein product [Moneuplotes crassus]
MCNLRKTCKSKFSSQTKLEWLQLSEFNNVTRTYPLFEHLVFSSFIFLLNLSLIV